jgi:hypothetical protein
MKWVKLWAPIFGSFFTHSFFIIFERFSAFPSFHLQKISIKLYNMVGLKVTDKMIGVVLGTLKELNKNHDKS